MPDTAMTENKFFHIVAISLGATFLGLMGYFAFTIQDSKGTLIGMAHDLSSIKVTMDQSFGWTSKRLDGHDAAIQELNNRVKTMEDRPHK